MSGGVREDDELPEGWAIARLTDVAEVNPPKPRADALAADAPVSFVPMPAVDADRGAITGAEERAFGFVRKGYTAFADGDVLLAKITPCFENGKAAVASGLRNGVGFGSSEFHVLRSRGAVLPEYLHLFVRQPAFREDGAENMTGSAGQARVPVEYVRGVDIPVPPLAEQRRIVAAVEGVLARIAAARARLAGVRRTVARFRQAVLAAACSGRLTEDWRDARAAPGAYVGVDEGPAAALGLDPLPEGWSWATLRSLVSRDESFCYGVVQPGEDVADGVPLVRAGDLHDITGSLSRLRRVPATVDRQHARSRLRGGEVLITVVGANIGTAALAPEAARGFNIARAVAKVPVRAASGRYVVRWLQSQPAREWMTGEAREVARPTLNIEQLAALPVPLPPREEQDEIVRRVDAAFTLADAVERRAAAALARVDRLPQAVLTRAFAGQLVPTEAELARAEGRDYEPAEALLRRHAAPAAAGASRRARAAVA